jgi:Uma2 family endonuclease
MDMRGLGRRPLRENVFMTVELSSKSSRRPELPAVRLFTAADMASLPTDVPSGTVDYELDNGRLVTIFPPSNLHGAAQTKIAAQLYLQGELNGLGKTRTEVGIVLWRNPDRVVGADVAFMATDSLPLRESTEGYLETIPDLVVEIKSRNDTAAYVRRKVDDYLAPNVRIVWVFHLDDKTVSVFHKDAPPTELREGDILTLDFAPDVNISIDEMVRP